MLKPLYGTKEAGTY
jgi:hypothetical protein